ncbi:MAG: hypothetical protein LBJ31_09145 [Treponema sp.]|jgi:hypothetical protein|nr:hypothetical protein [Treponema sp.]
MRQMRRIAAQIVFFSGLLLMMLGITFLLGSLTDISRLSIFRSFLFVIIGAVAAVFSINLANWPFYLFVSSFFILIGLFLFLAAMRVLPITFSQSWPLLSVFAGLALIPPGWRRYRAIRVRYLVPALAFVVLGCFLMVFSLKAVPFSFRRFMVNWWPLLVALVGVVLVLLSIGSGRNTPPGGDKTK